MTEKKEKIHYDHPAEEYLKNATGDVVEHAIRHHGDIASNAMFTLTPIPHRYLFCEWKGYSCRQTLAYVGFLDRTEDLGGSYHCFKCYNCKGLVEHNKILLAQQRNVLIGKDTEIVFDQDFIGSDQVTYHATYLDPPNDPVYKSVEVDDGRQRYSTLKELTPYQRFMYYARGFSNHPDFKIKKK